MYNQTAQLFGVTPPNLPPFIQPLYNAYHDLSKLNTQINLNLYPEPYYGDFTKCSVVLLTHNPGNSTEYWKGHGSEFERIIYAGNNPATNYYKMAIQPAFPNPATNRFYNNISNQLHQHFEGIQSFANRPFIRDLIPYHSSEFGTIKMAACADYLYRYFFNQVIEAAYNSELCQRINAKNNQPAIIIYARGTAWKNERFGLSAIGWERIGRIYRNGYIYKANFEKIQSLEGFDPATYPKEIQKHNVYIVVLTQSMQGAKYGIYINNRAPLQPVNLNTVIQHYDNGADGIDRNGQMELFINTIR